MIERVAARVVEDARGPARSAWSPARSAAVVRHSTTFMPQCGSQMRLRQLLGGLGKRIEPGDRRTAGRRRGNEPDERQGCDGDEARKARCEECEEGGTAHAWIRAPQDSDNASGRRSGPDSPSALRQPRVSFTLACPSVRHSDKTPGRASLRSQRVRPGPLDVREAGRAQELAKLGPWNIAVRAGNPLEYDAVRQRGRAERRLDVIVG